ncbi:hypothetical protein QBC45DRAFT_419460 [Copromyces sp. CBS 386.78]|nr:hypothetical protein QBC45DRAFT_419460 [Copromyces sp. CBS 386.78]
MASNTISTQSNSGFDNDFEGIQSTLNGRPFVVTCDYPYIFSTWSKWARCCDRYDPNCEFYTRCLTGTASGFNDATWNCNGVGGNCFSMTIFDHYSSATNSWVEIGCADEDWNIFTVYRDLDVSATSTSETPITSSSASTSEPSLTSIVATSTSIPPPPTQDPKPSSTSIPPPPTQDPKPSSSSSKAWIAGPVAGGIAALLLLGALFFWWRRRKNAQESNEGPAMAQAGTAGGYQPEYVGSPHNANHTPQQCGPSSPPSAPYYPPNSPPHYGSSSPPLHDASNASQYNYAASGTPNTMSWQGSPGPVSEQDAMGKQYQPFRPQIAEAP